jgi:hypothetical protein
MPLVLFTGAACSRDNGSYATNGETVNYLVQFVYLQLLDLLTTVAFLLNGIHEGNPLVRWVLRTAPSPLGGLLGVKILAVLLGLYCWRFGKQRLLGRINIMFAALIAWNLVALIAGSVVAAKSI